MHSFVGLAVDPFGLQMDSRSTVKRELTLSCESEAASMRTASRPALAALPMATVATGTPFGICTADHFGFERR